MKNEDKWSDCRRQEPRLPEKADVNSSLSPRHIVPERITSVKLDPSIHQEIQEMKDLYRPTKLWHSELGSNQLYLCTRLLRLTKQLN